MGQFFQIFNTDKMQKLNPQMFGDGMKFLEFGPNGYGTMYGLSVLMRKSTEGGGGDFHVQHGLADLLVGSWVGDRISIVGDYDEDAKDFWDNPDYVDISNDVVELLSKGDSYFKDRMDKYKELMANAGI